MSCSGFSTACTTVVDSVVPDLLPALSGKIDTTRLEHYYLTEQGARLAAKKYVDAGAFEAKYKLADQALAISTASVVRVTIERDLSRSQNAKDTETIKLLKRRLFWAHFWKYVSLGGTATMGVKYLFF